MVTLVIMAGSSPTLPTPGSNRAGSPHRHVISGLLWPDLFPVKAMELGWPWSFWLGLHQHCRPLVPTEPGLHQQYDQWSFVAWSLICQVWKRALLFTKLYFQQHHRMTWGKVMRSTWGYHQMVWWKMNHEWKMTCYAVDCINAMLDCFWAQRYSPLGSPAQPEAQKWEPFLQIWGILGHLNKIGQKIGKIYPWAKFRIKQLNSAEPWHG